MGSECTDALREVVGFDLPFAVSGMLGDEIELSSDENKCFEILRKVDGGMKMLWLTIICIWGIIKIPRLLFLYVRSNFESCRLRVQTSSQKRGLDMEKGWRRASR
jgi:hypothetical protein